MEGEYLVTSAVGLLQHAIRTRLRVWGLGLGSRA